MAASATEKLFQDLNRGMAQPLQSVTLFGQTLSNITTTALRLWQASVTTGAEQVFALTGAAVAAVGALGGLYQVAMRTTEALNPAAVQLFNMALRDLMATFGVALQPVIQGLTIMARDLAGHLLPLMKELAPVIADVMGWFASLLDQLMPAFVTMVKVVKDIVQTLKPFWQWIMFCVNVINDLTRVFWIFYDAVMRMIAGIFSIDLKDIFDSLRTALQSFLKSVLYITVAILRALGMVTAANAVVASAKAMAGAEKQDASGLAVATNVRYQGFADFGRDVGLRSAVAGPAGPQVKKTEDWLKDISRQLDGITDTTLREVITAGVREFWEWAKSKPPLSLLNPTTYDGAKDKFNAGVQGFYAANPRLQMVADLIDNVFGAANIK